MMIALVLALAFLAGFFAQSAVRAWSNRRTRSKGWL